MNLRDNLLPRLLPLAAALAVFFCVSALYFAPQFRGEVLPQHDVQQYEGMTRDILLERADSGEDPQWTGRMFGGMPAYLINVAYPAQLVKATVGQLVALIGKPAGFVFFAMLSMWLMLLIVGVDPWVGIVPSLAYGLSTYFFLIIGAGHITKMWALVYAPLMMGGIWMTLRGDKWPGAAITALCASLEIGANHPQITYYFLLAAALFYVSEFIHALRHRHLGDLLRRTGLLLLAGLLAVGSNFAPLWYTARHTADTMRGGSELAATAETSPRGLDLEYATAWSYGRAESWNLLIPDFMGGDSGATFAADGATARALRPYGLQGLAGQLPRYWGDQPYTAGPTYLGAVALFLALMGLLLASDRCRWWLLGASVLMLLLAWGRHFEWFTRLMFDYLPLYNKFRTVSMTLTVVEWTVPVLAAVALMHMWRGIPRERMVRALAWAAGITGGVCLLFAVAGGSLFGFGERESADFLADQYYRMFQSAGMEEAIAQGAPEELADATAAGMAAERAAVMRADAWRSLVMILLAAGVVWLFARRTVGRGLLVAALGVLVLADMIPVNLRYLPQFRRGPPAADRRHRRRPLDPARQGPRLPGAQPDGQPLQRRHDLLPPPLRWRLPRRQAGPLPGPDRPLPGAARPQRTRHAQHPLCDPPGRSGRARGRTPAHGQRRRMAREAGAAGRRCGSRNRSPRRTRYTPHGGRGPEVRPPARRPLADGDHRRANRASRRHDGRDPSGGIPAPIPAFRLSLERSLAGRILRNLLRQRVESLCGRRGNALPAGRLCASRPAAPGRRTHRRMALPGPRMGHDGRRHPRLFAADSRGSARGPDFRNPTP